jgi:hypothetical protein
MRCHRCAPTSPQLATREHIEERHQRDETEHGPCQLRAAPDITAGGQVNPHQDHGHGMEETDQEFEDLLHCLNLPGALWVPVRSCNRPRGLGLLGGPPDHALKPPESIDLLTGWMISADFVANALREHQKGYTVRSDGGDEARCGRCYTTTVRR